MRLYRFMVAVALPAWILSGCAASLPGLPGIGAGSGSAPLPAAVGALRGSIVSTPRMALSQAAEERALSAEYQALQFGTVGQPVTWEKDGFRGQFVPTQLYRVGSQDCRGYTHTITKNGASVRQVGTACRSEGEIWKPVA